MKPDNDSIDTVWRAALAGAEGAAVIIDPYANRIIDANAAAVSLLERDRATLLAAPIQSLLGGDIPRFTALTEEALTQGHAWSDAITILMPEDQPARAVELFLSRFDLRGRDGILMLLYRLDTVRARRAKAEYDRMRREGATPPISARWKSCSATSNAATS